MKTLTFVALSAFTLCGQPLCPPAHLSAQTILDRGVFVLTSAGAEAGREEFVIQASAGRGGSPGLRATSSSRATGRDVQQVIELTADYVPMTYQQTVTTPGRAAARVSAQLAGNRFSARISSPDGETAREFPVHPPLVILADEAYSTYYFLPRPTTGTPRTLSVVRPSDLRAVAATVESADNDTVLVGGQRVPARRFVLRIAGGDERRFWMTASGDLLQVAAGTVVATRAELPRR